MRAPPPPTLLSFPAHAAAGHRTPHCMGRDNHVPPLPDRPRAHPARAHPARAHPARAHPAHANKPTPGREHTNKQASRGKGAARPHHHPHPKQARQHPETQTPQANTKPQPPTEQTRPQQVQPHTRKHFRAHATARGQARKCERKTVGQHPGMKQSRRNPHKGGHAGQAHTRRARKPRCLRRSGAALRPPDGGETRAKGRSQ